VEYKVFLKKKEKKKKKRDDDFGRGIPMNFFLLIFFTPLKKLISHFQLPHSLASKYL